jgi:hypothetical protein
MGEIARGSAIVVQAFSLQLQAESLHHNTAAMAANTGGPPVPRRVEEPLLNC